MGDPTIGIIMLLGIATLILAAYTWKKVIHIHATVWRISKHLGLDPEKAFELSDRVKEIASDPARKIEAIKAYREETGAGLAEAKAVVEDYIRSQNT